MVHITPADDRPALRISDPIENAYYELFIDGESPPTVQPVDPDIAAPIDDAVRLHTTGISLPKRLRAWVYNRDFEHLGTVDQGDPQNPLNIDSDTQVVLEVASAPVKLYLIVPGDFAVESEESSVGYYYDEPRPITVATRSFHSKPAGTVQAAPSIDSEMRAISTLGSALKSTGPDRAWPTLRGHPPLIESAQTESIPSEVNIAPDDVTLRLPRDREAVYLAAPLAYYLNARVEPTDGIPEIDANGTTRPLTNVESDVNSLLQRVFLLDTLANRVGTFPQRFKLQDEALAVLEDDIDWEHIAQLDYPERTAAYLAPRFDPLEENDILDRWHLTTDITPDRDALGVLPFVAYDLSLVRVAKPQSTGVLNEPPEAAVEFMRTDVQAEEFMRAGTELADSLDIVQPRPADTPTHQWVGDNPAWETTYLDEQALRRRATSETPAAEDYDMSVRLVCNDPAMSHEFIEDIYGLRDLLRYDITTQYGLGPDELTEAFQADEDLLHYIGHVDRAEGLQCAGGEWLDLHSLDDVGMDTFVLNACESYEQGQALLDAGAFAGVVTLRNVNNARATRIGQEVARLLDAGFRFRSALSVIQSFVPASNQYIVLGAGGYQVVAAESAVPMAYAVDERDDGQYDFTIQYYTGEGYEIGSVNDPKLPGQDNYLGVNVADTWTIDRAALVEFMEKENLPVDWKGELFWSSNLALVLSPDTDMDLDDLLNEKYGLLSQPPVDAAETETGHSSVESSSHE
jgi:hypothetical protein